MKKQAGVSAAVDALSELSAGVKNCALSAAWKNPAAMGSVDTMGAAGAFPMVWSERDTPQGVRLEWAAPPAQRAEERRM